MKCSRCLQVCRGLALAWFVVATTGCSLVVARTTQNFADGLSIAIADANDPQTVGSALPAYILALEGMLVKDPSNADTLAATSKLYLLQASLFIEDPLRAKRASEKALGYARHSACLRMSSMCGVDTFPYQILMAKLQSANSKDVPSLYLLSTAWGLWIQTHKEDWSAVAQLAQVKAIMQRIVEIDETYEHGSVHVYLGTLESLVPPAMGGKPDVAKRHFEKAIEISAGKDLYAKVSYAQHYARLLFDRELHDKLLQDVLASDAQVGGFTLNNIIAQQQAQKLLESADAYF